MITVKVPATSANIGAGFDCLGIAFKLYNTFGFEEIEMGLQFQGFKEEYCNENNVVYQAMLRCFKECGYEPKGIKITLIQQDVPITRGLGSSSSCIVAGLIGANSLAGNKLTTDQILDLAVEIEGHPDNVAPAILGGMVVAIVEDGKTYYNRFNVNNNVDFIALIPGFMLSTEESRGVLPENIPFKDGVYSVGRAAFTLSCFATGNYEMLGKGCKDILHEPYRTKLIPNYSEIINNVYDNDGICAFLSGAGPTIMTLFNSENKEGVDKLTKYLETLENNWEVNRLIVENDGAQVY